MTEPATPTSSVPLLERRDSHQRQTDYERAHNPKNDDGRESSDISTSDRLNMNRSVNDTTEDLSNREAQETSNIPQERSRRQVSFTDLPSFSPNRNLSLHHTSLRSQASTVSSPTLLPSPQAATFPSSRHISEASTVFGRSTKNLVQQDEGACPAHGQMTINKYLRAWLFFLSLFCTLGSFVYLLLACLHVSWSSVVKNSNDLSTATFLCSLGAKLIEMAFSTTFVAYIGQRLSQKAFSKSHQGFSVSDMALRFWVYEPGTILMSFNSFKHSVLAPLGIGAFLAMIGCMFYTSAANSLVSPNLQMSKWAHQDLHGEVKTQFANSSYIKHTVCRLPGSESQSDDVLSNCEYIQESGQTFFQTTQWLECWKRKSPKDSRPPPTSVWGNSISINGSWINPVKQSLESSKRHDRMVDNVTLVFPHMGIEKAIKDKSNKLQQPTAFDGRGTLKVDAKVASPILNVACAAVSKKEIAPLVYTSWPNAEKNFNSAEYSTNPAKYDIPRKPEEFNHTAVDDIFGWDEQHLPPIFGTYAPLHSSLTQTWIVQVRYPSYHLLFGVDGSVVNLPDPGPPLAHPDNETNSFVLCQIKGGMTPGCTTSYKAQGSGSQIQTSCSEDNAEFYHHNKVKWDENWAYLADSWARAVNLGNGISKATPANSGLITRHCPRYDSQNGQSLPDDSPSMAEFIAMEASSTLLTGTIDATFHTKWPYDTRNLTSPAIESFSGEYQQTVPVSGIDHSKSRALPGILFIPLVLVPLLGLFALVCGHIIPLIRRRPFITDFTEQRTMFAVAMNSPSNNALAGACASGPSGSQIKSRWKVIHDADQDHYYYTTADLLGKNNPRWSSLSSSYSLINNKLKSRKSHASEV